MDYRLQLPKETVAGMKELGISQRDAATVLKSYVLEQSMSQGVPVIDPFWADNEAHHTQEEWIAYHNAQGKRMFGAPDLYRASDKLLPGLREGTQRRWIVAQPRLRFNPDNLVGRIIHNFGSTVPGVKMKEWQGAIPIYDGLPFSEILGKEEGVQYAQAFFDTQDDRKVIAERLEYIAQKRIQDILGWTPNQASRRDYPDRAAGFVDYYDRFLFYGYLRIDYFDGLSRGVSVSPRSGRAVKG